MSNMHIDSVQLIAGNVRVSGTKETGTTVRAYLNPNLQMYRTDEALYAAYTTGITTPKAEDGSSRTTFDLSLPVATVGAPYKVVVVSNGGKAEERTI